MDFSPDGLALAAGLRNGEICLFDAAKLDAAPASKRDRGQAIQVGAVPLRFSVLSPDICSNERGRWAATGYSFLTLREAVGGGIARRCG